MCEKHIFSDVEALIVCETHIFCGRHSVKNEVCEEHTVSGVATLARIDSARTLFSKVAMVLKIACLRNISFSRSPWCRRVTGVMLLASGYWLQVIGSRLSGPGYLFQPYQFQTIGSRSQVPDHW